MTTDGVRRVWRLVVGAVAVAALATMLLAAVTVAGLSHLVFRFRRAVGLDGSEAEDLPSVGDLLLGALEDSLERNRRRGGGPNPPPELSALKKADLGMPTEYPRRRQHRPAPWPPFHGVRVELGGDRA